MRFLLLLLMLLPASTRAGSINDEIIYFIMIDRFADGNPDNNQNVDYANPLAFQGGDLQGITANLDEIADLGATAIWITPIALQIDHPTQAEGKDFYPHHGYWAEDLTKIDPRYGTEADLLALTTAAHDRGMKIILDVVYNHMGFGASMTTEQPEWLRQGDECGGDPITLCLAGLPDLRTEDPEIQQFLFDAHIGLAERTGLDGFRLDTTKHITHEFWQAHRAEVTARLGEDFLLLGEVWDGDRFLAKPYFKNDELDALVDFSFRDRTQKFLSGVYDAAKMGRYLAQRHDVPEGYYLAPFLSNHDMSMILAMIRGDKDLLAIGATLLMTIEGPAIIAWGEEVGRRGAMWPDNREVMPWGDRDILPGAGIDRDEVLRESF
ncbi:MAG: alpha-amylase family glycosyl hydrolase, partial [Alphaproteobacteria bacterium]